MKTYMVIERFRPGCQDAVYERFHARGRLLPEGLHFRNSWRCAGAAICFQLMETADPALFEAWFERWRDLVEFELFEVGPGQPASEP